MRFWYTTAFASIALVILRFCGWIAWKYHDFNFSISGVGPRYQHELCILTRVKDISYLLPQWIEYHTNVGVDHIYIANDCSSDDGRTMFWAELYQTSKVVTVFKHQIFNNCTHHVPNEPMILDFLFQNAKDSCEWIAVIDADEYMYPSNPQKLSSDVFKAHTKDDNIHPPHDYSKTKHRLPLKVMLTELNQRSQPLARMPWFVMSTHGYETRPPGLVLNAYTNGKFEMVRKTLAKSRYVSHWYDSHTPMRFVWSAPYFQGQRLRDYARAFWVDAATEFHVERVVVSTGNDSAPWSSHHSHNGSTDCLKGRPTKHLRNHHNHSHTHPHSHSPHNISHPSPHHTTSSHRSVVACSLPNSPIVVHHFQGLSWQDNQAIRGARLVDSHGNPNGWHSQHARDMWLGYNFTYDPCSERSSRYTAWIARVMDRSIKKRIAQWVLSSHHSTNNDTTSLGEVVARDAVPVSVMNRHYTQFVNGEPFH